MNPIDDYDTHECISRSRASTRSKDELEHLAEQALGIEGSNQVSFDELCSPEFMQKCSDHGSIEEFIEDSPWTAESEAQFEAIPEEELDVHVA